jgi:hypothetical protein
MTLRKTMLLTDIAGNIERRLLISYRVDPEVVQPYLPAELRPQIIDGSAVAGICLIRMGKMRPSFIKPEFGWTGENAARRIAVEYEDDDNITRTGVFIPQRFSGSWLPVLAGGRVFPGEHKHSEFAVKETENNINVKMTTLGERFEANVTVVKEFQSGLFGSLEEASRFYQDSPVGWSPRGGGVADIEGVRLKTDQWKVEPGRVNILRSSFFEEIPKDQIEFDHALVMRNVPVLWTNP